MDLETRLESRYKKLVRSHMMMSDLLSNGVKSTLDTSEAFSQTQAAWRFFNNDRCELKILMQPILKSGIKQVQESCRNYVLVAHDWSSLSYKSHSDKKERYGIYNKLDLGYELQSSLLLSDIHGGPISPIAINLVNETSVLSTYKDDISRTSTHLGELSDRISYIESCSFTKECIHIVDREGDSVHFLRALEDKKWLVRCKGGNHVTHDNKAVRIDTLAHQLTFATTRDIMYSGKKVEQQLAEVNVQITRPAQVKKEDGKKHKILGKAVSARLIVSKILDQEGKVISWWFLLTNAHDVSVSEIALWYYWRWSIESFFKLLKTAGMHIESWQQESAEAIARRLLVACMACVFVWQIAEAKGPEASELRDLLIRLSGRQMKYGVKFTRPALFAGLCSLLNTLELVQTYDVQDLQNILRKIIGGEFV
jgi:hypothetical protein